MDHFEFSDCRVLVVGDVIIDKYLTGTAKRLSPEAPVPVLLRQHERSVLGGAANVAANIASLGAAIRVIGLIGEDAAGTELSGLLTQILGDSHDGLIVSPQRPTTSKTRVMSGLHQMVRIDSETSEMISPELEEQVIARVRQNLAWAHVVVLSDYAKGLCSDRVIRAVIEAARDASKVSLVDPKRHDFSIYRGATILTPNGGELSNATQMPSETDAQSDAAARKAIALTQSAILLTRSEKGMSYYHEDEPAVNVRATAREVFDVSGAGDTVVALAALGIAARLSMPETMRIANIAAGVVVSKVGTAVVSKTELDNAIDADVHRTKAVASSVVDLPFAVERCEQWRRDGLKVGFTNGVFDLLHPGHVSLLKSCAAECDRLIVAINSDASVKRLKGPTRPVQNQDARAFVLGALSSVDLILIFEEDTPSDLIAQIKPDLLVKGGDYSLDQVVGADLVQASGGKVMIVPIVGQHSTTSMIGRAHAAPPR